MTLATEDSIPSNKNQSLIIPMKKNKIKQIIKNLEKNGFTEYRKATGKKVKNEKGIMVHNQFKIRISLEDLKKELVK